MKKKQFAKLNRKCSIFAIFIFVVLAGVIGLTMAFSGDSSVINNSLSIAKYETVATETFSSPSNWKTCETIPKTITVTNNSDMPIKVRVFFEEDWIASDGTTHLPLISSTSGLEMAQLVLQNQSDWATSGKYYVYKHDLAKGATISSILAGVKLNCDANLNAAVDADGQYAAAEYHLKVIVQTIQADANDDRSLYNAVARQVNDLGGYQIDFTKKATRSNQVAIANGNGVNEYTEKGQPVYYFRGDVDNNFVIWGRFCWRIVRTTYSGGVKLVYYGVESELDTGDDFVSECTEYRSPWVLSQGLFSSNASSPADVGYMYGDRIESAVMQAGDQAYVFSNNVSRSGNNYALDTSNGQSISGTWNAMKNQAAVRYHYFCSDGAASCDNTKIGYILYFASDEIFYLPLNGYDDIEDAKAAMNANEHDSLVKSSLEATFAQENTLHEDDLEDAIFCNDRSLYSGSIKGKDQDGSSTSIGSGYTYYTSIANYRTPSLDCSNKNDAFTKNDTENGNGKLNHKVGLLTIGEIIMGGIEHGLQVDDAHITSNITVWTMSPYAFDGTYGAYETVWDNTYTKRVVNLGGKIGVRPSVSLKAGIKYTQGDGTAWNPYIIEQ